MKYYKTKRQGIFSNEDRILGDANGEFVPNGKEYFDRMGKGEIIENAPVFDYFHLQSFGPKEEWEWRLQDIHGGICEYPIGGYWYISDDFKILLENFKIAPKYHFYETRLLYKGNKLKYWIFQFPIENFVHINYQKTEFIFSKDDKEVYSFANREKYLEFRREEYRKTKKELFLRKMVLNSYFDLISNNGDNLVSEKLKTAIETMGLEGFLFSELDYEVIVNE